MRQCTMRRKTDAGEAETVSWIPEEFCKKGKALKLKNEKGDWEDGWVVTLVGSARRKSDEINDRSRDHLRQREASDRPRQKSEKKGKKDKPGK